jgi:hypothetical protein
MWRIALDMHMHIHTMHIRAYMVLHEHPDVHTSNHTSCPYMYVHWLLHEHIMLDTYKDGFFFYKKNQILHMTTCISEYYLGSYLDLKNIYLDNTGKNGLATPPPPLMACDLPMLKCRLTPCAL